MSININFARFADDNTLYVEGALIQDIIDAIFGFINIDNGSACNNNIIIIIIIIMIMITHTLLIFKVLEHRKSSKRF